MTDPFLFVLAVVALLATPGPTNTLLATAAASVGWRRAMPLLGGELAGYLAAIAAAHLLLGPALAASPVLASAVRVAVALWLVVLAIRLWRAGAPMTGRRGPVIVADVAATTFLNPKALVFAFGIIPFGTPLAGLYLAAFAALVVQAGAVWVLIGDRIGRHAPVAAPAVVPRLAAAVLSVFAGLIGATAFG
jgi:threonine/homoserine/homoserine lactone efflux protein